MKKYELESEEQEIHMQGDYVGVCWNLDWKEKAIKEFLDGEYRAQTVKYLARTLDEPYIDFVVIRKDEDTGKFYRDEDSPVAGGLDFDTSKKVLKELQDAVAYLGTLLA